MLLLQSQSKFALLFFSAVRFPESIISIDVKISLKPIAVKYMITYFKKMLALTHIFNMMANSVLALCVSVFLLQPHGLEEFLDQICGFSLLLPSRSGHLG